MKITTMPERFTKPIPESIYKCEQELKELTAELNDKKSKFLRDMELQFITDRINNIKSKIRELSSKPKITPVIDTDVMANAGKVKPDVNTRIGILITE